MNNMMPAYRPLSRITGKDIRQLVDVLFSKETAIEGLEICENYIFFKVTCTAPNGREAQSDKIYLYNKSIESPTLYLDYTDQSVYEKWLLAKGVDDRLLNNPFIETTPSPKTVRSI